MRHLLLISIFTLTIQAKPVDASVVYQKDDGKKAALSSCRAGDCQPLAVSKGRRDDDVPDEYPPPPKPKSAMASTLPDITTVSLPYAVEHYEAPAKSEPTYEMPRHWHPGDDHEHHGQVPEPATWALIGCGLVALAWRRR